MESDQPIIALLGVNLGNGNLGEEITATALIQNISQRVPGATIVEITSNPGDTKLRHKVGCIPLNIRAEHRNTGLIESNFEKLPIKKSITQETPPQGFIKSALKRIPFLLSIKQTAITLPGKITALIAEIGFLIRSYKRLENIDQLVVAGSGPLADNFGGPFAYPYLIYKWLALANYRNIPIVVFSVGAVPFESSLSKIFVRKALGKAKYVSFRDVTSERIIKGIGLTGDNAVFPDIAFSFNMQDYEKGSRQGHQESVGISLFPHFDPRYWPEQNSEKYQSYITVMADFCFWLISEGYTITFLSTQVRADILVMKDVVELLEIKNIDSSSYNIPTLETQETFFAELKNIDVMIVTRFHGMIMSLLSRTPVLGVANQQKMVDLMNDMKQGEYLINAEDADLLKLQKIFRSIVENKVRITESINKLCESNKSRLMEGYDNLFM